MKKKIVSFLCCIVLCMALLAGCGSDGSGEEDFLTGTFEGTITSIEISASAVEIEYSYEYDGETYESSVVSTDGEIDTEDGQIEVFDETYTLLDADGNDISVADIEEGASITITIESSGDFGNITLTE